MKDKRQRRSEKKRTQTSNLSSYKKQIVGDRMSTGKSRKERQVSGKNKVCYATCVRSCWCDRIKWCDTDTVIMGCM